MAIDPASAVTFGMAGLVLGAFAAGVRAQRQMDRAFVARADHDRAEGVRDERCARCDERIADCVTRETLRLQLEPIGRELEHRRGSMETLGRAVARTDRRLQRLEITIAAIATKLEVELPREADPEE